VTTQERREKTLVKEFLRFKSVRVHRLRSSTEFASGSQHSGSTGPDIKVRCSRRGQEHLVGIEVTEYQVDRGPYGSPARARAEFWRRIWRILRRNYFPRLCDLWPFDVVVTPRQEAPPRTTEARVVARELVDFVLAHPSANDDPAVFRSARQRGKAGVFDDYAALRRCVDNVLIRRRSGRTVDPPYWRLGGAAMVGVDPSQIARTISAKGKKGGCYDLTDTDECWLLICATGETVCDRAGPRMEGKELLKDTDVRDAVRRSGFDRVVFWERVGKWECTLFPRRA
jgi:hypothetical protein